MKAFLVVFAVVVASQAGMPAWADEECAAWCGDGKVWDDDRGECVIQPPGTS